MAEDERKAEAEAAAEAAGGEKNPPIEADKADEAEKAAAVNPRLAAVEDALLAAARAADPPPPENEPAAPPEPTSPAKEWGLAIALMLLIALIAWSFVAFLRQ